MGYVHIQGRTPTPDPNGGLFNLSTSQMHSSPAACRSGHYRISAVSFVFVDGYLGAVLKVLRGVHVLLRSQAAFLGGSGFALGGVEASSIDIAKRFTKCSQLPWRPSQRPWQPPSRPSSSQPPQPVPKDGRRLKLAPVSVLFRDTRAHSVAQEIAGRYLLLLLQRILGKRFRHCRRC